jgi:fructose-1-phosphate kinase PfkB-like protein
VLPAPLDGAYPVGSGDAFLAGLAIGLERGEDLVAAARRGAAAATANAMQPGAGRLDALVVDQLLDRIGAERIAAEAFLH